MTEIKRNDETDVTTFVNTLDETFVFHCNKQPFELKAGEKKIFPVYIAKLGAKHLADKKLQLQGIRRTMDDTPARRSILAEILPELADEVGEKPMSREGFQTEIQKELEKQKRLTSELQGQFTKSDEKSKELEETLKKQSEEIELLKKALSDKEEKKVAPVKNK